MKYFSVIPLLLISNYILANQTCLGEIKEVYSNPIGGYVQLDYGYGVNTICSVETELQRISPQSCKALYSGLLAADTQKKSVEIRYHGDFNCSVSELGNFELPKKEIYLISYN